jgi:hypothetical protein
MYSLIKALPKIAAREMQNTHVFPKNLKAKYELIAEAYGAAAVEDDFTDWCREVRDRNPRYPITEYIKVVDARLGRAFEEAKADLKDPRIPEIAALTYDLTGYVPTFRSVGNILLSFTQEEIEGALREYVSTLDDKDVKMGMKTFFMEGGATTVILARQKRK